MNMRYPRGVLGVLLALLAVAACERADGLSRGRAMLIENELKKTMLDPEATRITWWPAEQPDSVTGAYTYCALVNGKNLYGAYSGDTLFGWKASLMNCLFL